MDGRDPHAQNADALAELEDPDTGDYIDAGDVDQVVDDAYGEPMSDDDGEDGELVGTGEAAQTSDDQGVVFEDDSVQGFFEHKEPVYAVALHPTDPTLAASGGGDDRSYLWRIDTGEKVADLGVHTDSVTAVQFSATGSYVASGGMDGKVFVFDAADGRLVNTLEGPSEVTWLNWHPRGNVLLAGAEDSTIWMWQIPQGNCMNVFSGHSESVSCGQFTPDGKRIVTASTDGSMIIWDPKTAVAIHRLTSEDNRFHQTAITSLSISPDSSLVLSGAQDGSLRLVQISQGKIAAALDGHQDSVEAVGFANGAPLAATAAVDGKIIIWDTVTLRQRHTMMHDDAVTRMRWQQTAPLFATASMDTTVRLWDARTGECLNKWQGHHDAVLDLAIRSDGAFVLTGSDDGVSLVFQA